MNDQTIRLIVDELVPWLAGRQFGKVFQLSRTSLAIDFRTGDGRYLFIDLAPDKPRLYMIARTVRELEKASLQSSPFVLALRKHLAGARLLSPTKDERDRVVRFSFEAYDATGEPRARTLVAQLTGRTANLFLLDDNGRVIDALRPSHGEGQEVGDTYRAPVAPERSAPAPPPPFRQGAFATFSEAADDYYRAIEARRAFDARATALSARLRGSIEKRRKLLGNLKNDLAAHGDADEHKRVGDLLLANVANAERIGPVVRLTDYYADDAPTIELEIDENRTLQEEAAHRFARYAKARRAAQEIAVRIEQVRAELDALEVRRAQLEKAVAERDEAALDALDDERRERAPRPASRTGRVKAQQVDNIAGARRYRSSDGYEILVGRGARDNDQLTFRVARPHDLWLHTADYPGSHVIVRNPSRAEDVPHRTVIEAAQLAANFSQARRDAKVAVNYTQRKFVSKPKGAAPGLVRLSSFRTLLVEPREGVERILT